MRRKDREMDRDWGLQVIDRAPFAVLSVTDTHGDPYAIPLSVAREGEYLYFHSARSGTKVDLLQSQPLVCMTFVTDVNVPELFSEEELEEMRTNGDKAPDIGSKVFTTEYASAIVYGKVESVTTEEGKRRALEVICRKYAPDKMALFDMAAASGMKLTNIYRIAIEQITAKRKKYDAEGREMKGGREE
ncbi:pyridoxamine 5'-phosphate oxidase family protein [uncultured Proteiniphilum sp.]|uniref:pyridoxamine 5'-phosphate oxidase family protein n=1 Tax=uncultured Proteiniphilum sp. TaxID=497637 RepID=UPI0026254B96|nr:pyridoxamine 5'-phosphate oxidase family protein [uncultured Proteiniphilum sp.]